MKLIYMQQTIEFVVNSTKTQSAMDWAKAIIENGEMKTTQLGLNYIVLQPKT